LNFLLAKYLKRGIIFEIKLKKPEYKEGPSAVGVLRSRSQASTSFTKRQCLNCWD